MSEKLILPEQEVVLNEEMQMDGETVQSVGMVESVMDENTELLKQIDSKLDLLLESMNVEG